MVTKIFDRIAPKKVKQEESADDNFNGKGF